MQTALAWRLETLTVFVVCGQAQAHSQPPEIWLGLCQGTRADDLGANWRKWQSLGKSLVGALTRVPPGVTTWAALAQHASC